MLPDSVERNIQDLRQQPRARKPAPIKRKGATSVDDDNRGPVDGKVAALGCVHIQRQQLQTVRAVTEKITLNKKFGDDCRAIWRVADPLQRTCSESDEFGVAIGFALGYGRHGLVSSVVRIDSLTNFAISSIW
jgi:hypothetical protein